MEKVAISPRQLRQIILEQSKRAKVGHIGSALSVADIVATLYDSVLKIPHPDDRNRDRFILSKGHAALAVYAALYLKGWLAEGQIETYCGNETLLGVHPEHQLKGIDFSTGSLGQGLSIATGAALGAKFQKSSRRTFTLLSDAECNEGSVWEAVMFAAHHHLSNLIVILDLNGQQALGYTDKVISLNPMADRWRSFGWDVHEVDGHDTEALAGTIESLDTDVTTGNGQPHILIAHTTFGKGVSYMENQIKWHYLPMDDQQYRQALSEIGIQI